MKGRDEDGYPQEGVDLIPEHKGKWKLLHSHEDFHAGNWYGIIVHYIH